jgi:hypothetical protein
MCKRKNAGVKLYTFLHLQVFRWPGFCVYSFFAFTAFLRLQLFSWMAHFAFLCIDQHLRCEQYIRTPQFESKPHTQMKESVLEHTS